MKKILLLLLVLCLALSLAACSQEPAPPTPAGEDGASELAGLETLVEPTDDPREMGIADLTGRWEMIHGETEGYSFDAGSDMTAYLEFFEDGTAAYSVCQWDGEWQTEENIAVTREDTALYDGCENDAWCARLLVADPNVELYAAPLDRTTLQVLQFTYFDENDEYPVVSIATYRRLPTAEQAAESLAQLRQTLTDGGYVCGVAYLDVCDGAYPDGLQGYLRDTAYPTELPFVTAIDDDHWADWYGYDLYCVVPADPSASVAVNVWDPMTGEDGEVLYRSESGDPIVIQCNGDEGYTPNTHVIIVDSSGSSVDFFPMMDAATRTLDVPDRGDPWMYDFTLYNTDGLTPEALLGDWAAFDLTDGDGNPRTCGLSFYEDGTMEYWYGEPMSDILERFEGTWFVNDQSPTATGRPLNVQFDMTLTGGAVLEDGGVEPYDFWGTYDISLSPNDDSGDFIVVEHIGGNPLLYGRDYEWFDFVRSVG